MKSAYKLNRDGENIRTDIADDVTSVEEFLRRYYKPERLNSTPGKLGRLVACYEEELATQGKCVIPRHDSSTGCYVEYYGSAEMAVA